ncbi:uncharacterized protein DUF4334 [Nocardia tenerifensis]|uniref:Uncharacterized protein DUF4334 n=1 Tax=Nocardia tenerifensis TaxID=228006 RepID=A0A318KHZ0_9NOCA|nr:GXWXG domain-containing protein [Nocardia tenerifensis]PXX71773.1 uncharacterized protein DUF4334 [Nocardia tenerifensis]
MVTESASSPADELQALQAGGCTQAQAWDLFDRLPAASVETITVGRWRGEELDTGHPFAGTLTASGWLGKQFDTSEQVYPLVFSDEAGHVFAIDPRFVSVHILESASTSAAAGIRKALRFIRPAVRTRSAKACLRDILYRGVVSAALIYDHRAAIDYFRRVDEKALLGVEEIRDMAEPFFFVLRR